VAQRNPSLSVVEFLNCELLLIRYVFIVVEIEVFENKGANETFLLCIEGYNEVTSIIALQV
jgi:hypothetical protein